MLNCKFKDVLNSLELDKNVLYVDVKSIKSFDLLRSSAILLHVDYFYVVD